MIEHWWTFVLRQNLSFSEISLVKTEKIEITDFGFPDLGYLIVEGEKIESTDFGSDSKDFGFLQ